MIRNINLDLRIVLKTILLFFLLILVLFNSESNITSFNHQQDSNGPSLKIDKVMANPSSASHLEQITRITETADIEDILVSVGSDLHLSPSIAVDSNNILWSVYNYNNGTHEIIELVKSTNEGESWTIEAFIYSTSTLRNPDIAIDLYDNNVYVVY